MVHNKIIRQICAYTAQVKQRYHTLPCNLSLSVKCHILIQINMFHIVMYHKDLILFLKVK